jgi:hypothetical protein
MTPQQQNYERLKSRQNKENRERESND